MNNTNNIKSEILSALAHEEAEDGLFLDNFLLNHPEDERPKVSGTEAEILACIEELIAERKVKLEETGGKVVFRLA